VLGPAAEFESLERCMDYNAAACTFLVTQLVLGTVSERDPFLGLPCFIFYSRIFQLILRVWM
jgi:hypothetical protein